MKNNFDSFVTFDFSKAEVADINSLLKQRIPNKRTGTDTIPQKLVIGKQMWLKSLYVTL